VLRLTAYGEVAERNVEASRRLLRDLGVPIVAEDTGGGKGRKVEFDTGSGRLVVNEERIL